jgi:hypothetical protein
LFAFELREISEFARPAFAGQAAEHTRNDDLTPPANAVFLHDFGKPALNFSTHDATA